MTRWSIGSNNIYFSASIYLKEAPWYIFLIDSISAFICHWIPRIPLPPIKIKRDNEIYKLGEYYGTIGDLFHLYIHMPIFNWCYRKIKETNIRFPYQMLDELFPNELLKDKYSDDEELKDEIKINKEVSEKVCEEFKIIYDKLGKL